MAATLLPMPKFRRVLPGVKRPGREADHSTPSSAEVKNAWRYTSTPQHVFVVWCLQSVTKHRWWTWGIWYACAPTSYSL